MLIVGAGYGVSLLGLVAREMARWAGMVVSVLPQMPILHGQDGFPQSRSAHADIPIDPTRPRQLAGSYG